MNEKITIEFFIKPGEDLDKDDEDLLTIVNLSKRDLRDRWTKPRGQNILKTWKAHKFDRETLEQLVGKYYGHIDLRGIPLRGEDLSGCDLSFIDFFGADLRNADFSKSNLEESWLSESDIRGAKFDWARMDGVLLDNVIFDNRTSFQGVNLNAINFTLAALLQDLALNQQRIVHLKSRYPWLAFFLSITSDYGRSLSRFTLWCVGIILAFGIAYFYFWPDIGSVWNALYASLLLFLTVGVEIPKQFPGVLRFLVALEIVVGYMMMGLLIAIFVRKTIGE